MPATVRRTTVIRHDGGWARSKERAVLETVDALRSELETTALAANSISVETTKDRHGDVKVTAKLVMVSR